MPTFDSIRGSCGWRQDCYRKKSAVPHSCEHRQCQSAPHVKHCLASAERRRRLHFGHFARGGTVQGPAKRKPFSCSMLKTSTRKASVAKATPVCIDPVAVSPYRSGQTFRSSSSPKTNEQYSSSRRHSIKPLRVSSSGATSMPAARRSSRTAQGLFSRARITTSPISQFLLKGTPRLCTSEGAAKIILSITSNPTSSP
jgi:hypothetical protein